MVGSRLRVRPFGTNARSGQRHDHHVHLAIFGAHDTGLASRIETCVSRAAICNSAAGRGFYCQRLPQNVSLWSASFLDAIVVAVRQRVLVFHLERDAADIPDGAGCEDPPIGLDLRLT